MYGYGCGYDCSCQNYGGANNWWWIIIILFIIFFLFRGYGSDSDCNRRHC